MDIDTFVERSNQAETPDEVLKLFEEVAAGLGYTKIAYLGVNVEAIRDLVVFEPEIQPLIACNYPRDYLSHYVDEGYLNCDYALINTMRLDTPFLWEEIVSSGKITRKQKMLASDSRAAGLYDGVTIPLHSSLGRKYAVCLARDNPNGGHDHRHLLELQILGSQLHYAYMRVARNARGENTVPALSERERECLKWTAVGKSAWSIGKILGLSEQTINAYMKSAMKKLNASNRVSAVVCAIQHGLISP